MISDKTTKPCITEKTTLLQSVNLKSQGQDTV